MIWFVSLLVGALCVEVGLVTLRHSYSVPLLVKSVLLTLRHDLVPFLLGALVNEVDFDDLEV